MSPFYGLMFRYRVIIYSILMFLSRELMVFGEVKVKISRKQKTHGVNSGMGSWSDVLAWEGGFILQSPRRFHGFPEYCTVSV